MRTDTYTISDYEKETKDVPKKALLFHYADILYDRIAAKLLLGFAFVIPLKLSIAYGFLAPVIILWLLKVRFDLRKAFQNTAPLSIPLYYFIIFSTFTSLFGLDPFRSIHAQGSAIFCSLVLLATYDLTKLTSPLSLVIALLLGETVAGLDAVFSHAFPETIPRIFLGRVTESGQMCLTFLLALGVTMHLGRKFKRTHVSLRTLLSSSQGFIQAITDDAIIGFLFLLSLSYLSFAASADDAYFNAKYTLFATALIFAVAVAKIIATYRKDGPYLAIRSFLVTIALPVIATALLSNLKRGPWFGVLVGSTVFLLMFSRKYILPLIVLALFICALVTPIRTRLSASADHFFIHGGRNVIWNIGVDLARKYPLGVGIKNASVLQKYSAQIPPDLKHFHNNLLNIVVETGWIGLALFVWWIASVLRFLLTRPESRTLFAGIGCAIIAWQVAGVVEYNFGDSEIYLVAIFLLGIASGITQFTNGHSIEVK